MLCRALCRAKRRRTVQDSSPPPARFNSQANKTTQNDSGLYGLTRDRPALCDGAHHAARHGRVLVGGLGWVGTRAWCRRRSLAITSMRRSSRVRTAGVCRSATRVSHACQLRDKFELLLVGVHGPRKSPDSLIDGRQVCQQADSIDKSYGQGE